MSNQPQYGQHAPQPRAELCPRHPSVRAVGYCKRCGRPTCPQCTIPTEVGSICVECANPRTSRSFVSRAKSGQALVTWGIAAVTAALWLVSLIWPNIDDLLAFNPVWAYVEPWRFLTVSLTHGGFFHLLFNMLMLVLIGMAGEQVVGRWRFLMLYLISTLGGSVAVLAWVLIEPASASVFTVGASGAIYGLLGAVLVGQLRAGISPRSILTLLAVNIIYSFTGGISWQGHLGGLAAGILLAYLYSVTSRPRPGQTQRTQTLLQVGLTVGVAGLLAAAAFLIYQASGIPQMV